MVKKHKYTCFFAKISKKALKIGTFRPLKYIYKISYNLTVGSTQCIDISLHSTMTYSRFLTAVSHLLKDFPPTLASVASRCHILADVGIFFGVHRKTVKCRTFPDPLWWRGKDFALDDFFVKGKNRLLFKGGLSCCRG